MKKQVVIKRIVTMLSIVCLLMFTVSCSSKEDTNNQTQIVRIGGLKGPTSMGLVWMMQDAEDTYDFSMVTAADALVGDVVSGKVDIALLPANVAANLYQKTNRGITVIEINTLGVLYIVEQGETISSLEDLKGRTLYMTGKGQTPDYALMYLLEQAQINTKDIRIEYKSEATEVVSALLADTDGIGLLPQPFVTTALMNNKDMRIALDLTKLWDDLSDNDSSLITGVTIVRNEFLEQNPKLVDTFLEAHKAAIQTAEADLDKTAEKIEQADIVKAAIAKKAYPYCNIVSITGDKMKTLLSGYLNTLFQRNPASVGGELPGEDFYFAK